MNVARFLLVDIVYGFELFIVELIIVQYMFSMHKFW